MTQQARAEKLVGSANVSLGFVENGLMFNLNLGDPGQANINLPGYGAGFHLPYYGGGPQGGIGFNSISDLGRMFRGFVSDVKSVFSSVGNFFGNIFGGIGDFFSSIFPVALDLNGDRYQHLTAWAAPGDALLAYDANNDVRSTSRTRSISRNGTRRRPPTCRRCATFSTPIMTASSAPATRIFRSSS